MNKQIIVPLLIIGLTTQSTSAMLALRNTSKTHKRVVEQPRRMSQHIKKYSYRLLFPHRKIYPSHLPNYLNRLQSPCALSQTCEKSESAKHTQVKSDLNHFFNEVSTLGILMTIGDACSIEEIINNVLPDLSTQEKEQEFSKIMILYDQLHSECPLSINEKENNNMLRHPLMKP